MTCFLPSMAERQAILYAFGIRDKALDVVTLLDARPETDAPNRPFKLIEKIVCRSNEAFVVKYLHKPSRPVHLLERQSAFSEYLRAGGIPCARQRQSNNRYCIQTMVSGCSVTITLEEFEPGEVTVLDPLLAERVGALLARTHALSLATSYRVNGPTIFDILSDNDMALLKEFERLRTIVPPPLASLYEQVHALCLDRRARVTSALRHLSPCAVQGDISINNLFLNDKGLGLFDFNNCGDVHPVSDLVLEGLMLVREMDYPQTWTPAYGDQLFSRYLTGYMSERPLTDIEKRILPDIYSLGITLYMMQIKWGEASLKRLLESDHADAAEALLITMRGQICRSSVVVETTA